MKKQFKKTLLLLTISLFSLMAYSQYVPATAPETTYDPGLFTTSCTHNDVGTDTRSDDYLAPYGYSSPFYGNYLNVTVNSCPGTSGFPGFYWKSSYGTSGNSPLPFDAQDPDVILISPGGDALPPDVDRIWAIAVYYSATNGGYCMSMVEFNTGTYTFPPISGPILIQPYTPTGYEPHINIDSDHYGRYAVVMQMNTGILSKTQTVFSVPTPPANDVFQPGLIEPDIACLHNSAFQSNIIALTPDRSRYHAVTRNYLSGPTFSPYTSFPSMPDLYQPRIAAPKIGKPNEYSITVGRKYPMGLNIIFDILFQINEGNITQANAGLPGFPSAINVNNTNSYPCITYAYGGGPQVSLGWYTDGVPGIFPIPNQPSTFIGLDINPNTILPSTPSKYLDISNLNGTNNESVMAISGRYAIWSKSAAFTYEGPVPLFAGSLMWKILYSPSPYWKNTEAAGGITTLEKDALLLYPNPANDQISFELENIEDGYKYEVVNQLGQTILKSNVDAAKVTISLDQWPSGLYFIRLENQKTKEIYSRKFVKE